MAYLLVYYNPNTDTYFFKIHDYYIATIKPLGYINQFGHQLIQVLVYDTRDGHLKNWSKDVLRNEVKLPLKKRLINRMIDFLEERR